MECRIKEVRKSLKLSQTDFGKRLGVSRDVINNIENKRVAPSESLVKLIAAEFHVSETWLRTGEGDMRTVSDEDASLASLFSTVLSEDCPPDRRRTIKSIMSLLSELPDDLLPEIGRYLRFLAHDHKNKEE